MVAPSKEPVPNDDRIVEYYQRIADGLSIPIVLQDHPASTEVHLSPGLILKLVRHLPTIAMFEGRGCPDRPKIRQLRDGLGDKALPILTGWVRFMRPSIYRPDRMVSIRDLRFRKCFRRWSMPGERRLAARLSHLPPICCAIVFEQQPGVAVRKELLRRRGLLTSARARHPGATITAALSRQLDAVVEATLPGTDLTQPLTVEHISEPA